ncbi:TonB-dependent receptor [Rhizorhabdus argentea]|uniref:TonB-dependent receptor n=1 Tax=Rhizorhabdus argentea TaxID=1387174 RepID=UPI0030EB1518
MSSIDRQACGLNTPAFLALGCIGFIASAPALAQDSGQPAGGEKRLGGMTVTDTAIDEEGYKAERVESPKAVAPLLDTPRSIVVVDKQVIKDTGAATLVDALRTVPGITFGAAEGGNPIGDRPFIRGFDSQGSTYLDGVRDIGAQTREIFAVEQIQVVRGSDSTLGGRGSAGGSLNVISKLPERETFFAGTGSYGTDDYKRITGDVNYRLNDKIAFRVTGMWHDQDVAGRDAIYQKRWGIAPSVTIGMDGPTKLTLSYYHLDTDELPDSGLPFLYACSATICNAPLGSTITTPALGDVTTAGGVTGHVGRSSFYGIRERDFRDSKTDQATMRIEHDFGNGIKIRNTSRFGHNYQAYSFTLPDDSLGNVFGTTATNTGANVTSGGYVWTRSNNRYGYSDSIVNQSDIYGTLDTGSIKHSFAIGTELSWEKARRGTFVTRGFTNTAGNEILSTGSTISPRCNATTIARAYCVSLFDPQNRAAWINYASDTSNVVAPIVKSLPIAETQTDASTKAIYAFDSITLTEQLILNLGARYDRFESKVRPGQPIAATDSFSLKRKDDIFNYQVGLIFKPTANTSLYASYATAATPPNSLIGEGQEQNGLGTANTAQALAILDSLKVEKTKSMEIGAKADLFGGGLSITGAVFQTKTRNARATSDAGTVVFIGERRIRGVELGFNGNITDDWNVFGGYTYLDAKVIDAGFTALTVAANGPAAATSVAVPSAMTGKRFPQTAKHSFTLWTNYKVTEALSIGGGAFYSSRVYGGYGDDRRASQTSAGVVTVTPITRTIARAVPSYWRFDARLGYKLNDNIDLAVNIQNLTDKTYFSQVYTSHYATIAAGRSAFATLSFKY